MISRKCLARTHFWQKYCQNYLILINGKRSTSSRVVASSNDSALWRFSERNNLILNWINARRQMQWPHVSATKATAGKLEFCQIYRSDRFQINNLIWYLTRWWSDSGLVKLPLTLDHGWAVVSSPLLSVDRWCWHTSSHLLTKRNIRCDYRSKGCNNLPMPQPQLWFNWPSLGKKGYRKYLRAGVFHCIIHDYFVFILWAIPFTHGRHQATKNSVIEIYWLKHCLFKQI